jgi:hypothetical protein
VGAILVIVGGLLVSKAWINEQWTMNNEQLWAIAN